MAVLSNMYIFLVEFVLSSTYLLMRSNQKVRRLQLVKFPGQDTTAFRGWVSSKKTVRQNRRPGESQNIYGNTRQSAGHHSVIVNFVASSQSVMSSSLVWTLQIVVIKCNNNLHRPLSCETVYQVKQKKAGFLGRQGLDGSDDNSYERYEVSNRRLGIVFFSR